MPLKIAASQVNSIFSLPGHADDADAALLAHKLHRRVDRRGGARALDDEVRAAPAGQLHDTLLRVDLREVHHVIDAKLLRRRQAQFGVRGRADDHDLARARALRNLRGKQPDRPGAEHDYEVLRLDLRALAHVVHGVRRRLHQRAGVEADAVGQPVQQTRVHHQVLREGPVDPPPGRALVGADLHVALPAEPALLAGERVRLGHHAIADLQPVTPSPSSTMTPENSCPRVTGGQYGNLSWRMWMSVPQIAAALTSIFTQPGCGDGSGTSRSSILPTPFATFCSASIVSAPSVCVAFHVTVASSLAPEMPHIHSHLRARQQRQGHKHPHVARIHPDLRK